tara:strand:- start:84 stop:794 length:711 start_codon:yes stop_codon:yes gene_type:complete
MSKNIMLPFSVNVEKAYHWYKPHGKNLDQNRYIQLEELINKIRYKFDFEKIICIETGASQNHKDGCVGLFFAKLCELTDGEFHSIDNNKDTINKSKELYSNYNLNVNHHLQDSVEFLKNTLIVPNLIHLDSWDLDLFSPFPSALHGWREFTAIENKMPIGSIIIIDDNWFKGSWVRWNYIVNGEYNGESTEIPIEYPIIGKGSLIYHFVEGGESNWKKLSIDKAGFNEKIIFKKIK